MTKLQRTNVLRSYYGFTCSCRYCSQTESDVVLSDARRQLIHALLCLLKGYRPAPLTKYDNLTINTAEDTPMIEGLPLQKLGSALHPAQHTALSFLLASLMDAEKMLGKTLAGAYRDAAYDLLTQMDSIQSITVLKSAEICESWMKRALDVLNGCLGKTHNLTKEYERLEGHMRTSAQLDTARMFSGGGVEAQCPGSYAVLMKGEDAEKSIGYCKILDRNECWLEIAKVLKKRDWKRVRTWGEVAIDLKLNVWC
jgi:hypothetical protein